MPIASGRNTPAPLPNITLRAIEVFVTVAHESTMSAAARKLGMSQAAVSQSVGSLEDGIGVQLFDRSMRPPMLTLAGHTVLQQATEIVAKVRELADTMRLSGSRTVPLLRIGMLNSLASTVGAPFLKHLRDLALEWTVVSGFEATTLRALLARVSDVIVTSDETPPPPEIALFPVCSEPFVLALPASFEGRYDDVQALAEKLDFIRYGHDTHMGPKVQAYLEQIGVSPPRHYQFDTTDAALQVVAGGFGWTIVTPIILLKSMTARETIRVAPLGRAAMYRHIIVGVRRGEGLAIAERVRAAAVDALRDAILPRIAAVLPEFTREITLHDSGASRHQ